MDLCFGAKEATVIQKDQIYQTGQRTYYSFVTVQPVYVHESIYLSMYLLILSNSNLYILSIYLFLF